MKTKRFEHAYRNNSSKLHRKVGDVLRGLTGSLFSGYTSYQEYPVSKINSTYPNSSHKFDWIVNELKLVIECHGAQHFNGVTFGGISKEEALDKYHDQVHRDNRKSQAAIDAGWTYIMIPYWDYDKINDQYIYNLYRENLNPHNPIKKTQKSKYDQDRLEKAKQARKQRYQKHKAFKKSLRRSKNDPSSD